MTHSFSIVVPVYNSSDSLSVLCEKSFKTFVNDEVEIILVDDGSNQSTWEQIKNLKIQYSDKIKGIRLSKNFGQHNATLCGINHATKKYIVTIDDDLQYLPESIPLLHQTLLEGNFDVVYGLPLVKKQSPIRIWSLQILYAIAWLLDEKVPKTSAFRLMKRELAHHLKSYKLYYVIIDVVLSWYSTKIGYCEVPHYSRTGNRSGYSTWRLMKMTMKSVIAYSAIPYKVFIGSFVLAGLIFSSSALYYFMSGELSIEILVAILAFLSVLFTLGFGLLFAYLYHIAGYMGNKPLYLIAEEV